MGKFFNKVLAGLAAAGLGLTLTGCGQNALSAEELATEVDAISEQLETFTSASRETRAEVDKIFRSVEKAGEDSFKAGKITQEEYDNFVSTLKTTEKEVVKNIVLETLDNSLEQDYFCYETGITEPGVNIYKQSQYDVQSNEGTTYHVDSNNKWTSSYYDGTKVLASEDTDDIFETISDIEKEIKQIVNTTFSGEYTLESYEEDWDRYVLLPVESNLSEEIKFSFKENCLYKFERRIKQDKKEILRTYFNLFKITKENYTSEKQGVLKAIKEDAENGEGYITKQQVSNVYGDELING